MANMTLADYRTRIKRKMRDFQNLDISTDEIDDILNDGYLDFVTRTLCTISSPASTGSGSDNKVTLLENVGHYSLPADTIQILRAEYVNGDEIQIRQTDWMDAHYGYDWRAEREDGDYVDYIVQDNSTYTTFRVYPILETFEFTVPSDQDVLKMDYDSSGSDTDVSISSGSYDSTDDFCSAIEDAIEDAFSDDNADVSVNYSATTGKITIGAGSGHTLSYTDLGSTGGRWIGFYQDQSAAASLTGDVGIKHIIFDYVYEPTAMSATTDYPAFPSEYHKALFYYAMHEILETAPTDTADYKIADYYYNKYIDYVVRCKRRFNNGLIRNRQPYMSAPRWI